MNEFEITQGQTSLISVDPAAVAAAETAKAKVQASYIVALQKPRNEDEARARILKACKRPEFAKDVEFKKPVGNTNIIDLSIRFAELAFKEWGNLWTDVQTLYESETTKRIKVSVTDLETNVTHSREPQIKKTVERKSDKGREVVGERLNTYGQTVFVVMATEDEMMTKENAIISKNIRNEGLRLIPHDIKEEARQTARTTLRNQMAADPDREKKAVIDGFSSLGIMPRDLADYMGHSLDIISAKELEDLRGIYKAIKDGEASFADFISTKTEEDNGVSQDAGKKLKAGVFDAEFKDVSRTHAFKAYWKGSVEHYAKHGKMSEEELKINIMADPESKAQFRQAFKDFEVEYKKKKADAKKQKTESKTAAAQKKKSDENSENKLHESDVWQEYLWHKHNSYQIWDEETGGKDPLTIESCVDINDRIQARIDAVDSATPPPPSDDDIPM